MTRVPRRSAAGLKRKQSKNKKNGITENTPPKKETLGSSKNEDKEKKMKAITHFRTFKKQTNKKHTKEMEP